MGVIYPALRNKKDQNALVASAVSQVPLTHNNRYAKVAYFGVTNLVSFLSFKVFFFHFCLESFISTVNQEAEMK